MRKTCVACCIVALALVSTTARAELRVTLTIDGDINEMVAVLQQLQALGLGGSEAEADDPLKLRVESVHEQAPEPEAETQPEPEPEPVLALTRPTAQPEPVAPGGELTLSVAVIDERRVVDTMSAAVEGLGLACDLFDNGTHGDVTPADGVWTAVLPIPADAVEGGHEVTFIVYDGAGNPLTAPTPDGGAAAVTASTQVTVTVPAAPAEPTGEESAAAAAQG